MKKQVPLDNPVLWFSSAVYKCEAQVRQSFRLGMQKKLAGDRQINEGLRLALEEKVPVDRVLCWLKDENVCRPTAYARMYERILNRGTLASRIVKGEITFNKATGELGRTTKIRTREQVGKLYIHQLAMWMWKTGADFNKVTKDLREEFDAVCAEKAANL